MRYFILNILLAMLPPTRMFGLKRLILRVLGVSIGSRSKLCGRCKFYGGGTVTIGNDCWISIGVAFYTSPGGGNVHIGDRCDVAPEVAFHTGSHLIGRAWRRAGTGTAETIKVGDGCWIGFRCSLLAGARVEDGSVIGAQTLLLARTYPASSLILGTPAKVVRFLDDSNRTNTAQSIAQANS